MKVVDVVGILPKFQQQKEEIINALIYSEEGAGEKGKERETEEEEKGEEKKGEEGRREWEEYCCSENVVLFCVNIGDYEEKK